MKTGAGRLVMDPGDFLPSYGENDVLVTTTRSELRVCIEYDGPNDLAARRTMIFEQPVAFQVASLPGVAMLSRDYGGYVRPVLDGLIEFPDSELAATWRAHFLPVKRDINRAAAALNLKH